MGVDYSGGIGYGIAAELTEENREAVGKALESIPGFPYDHDEYVDGNIYEACEYFHSLGIDGRIEGDAYGGPEYAMFLLEDTVQEGEHRESGVWPLTDKASDVHRLDVIRDALRGQRVEFVGPAWVRWQSVS